MEDVQVTTRKESKYGQIEKGTYIEIACGMKRVELDSSTIYDNYKRYFWTWANNDGASKRKNLPDVYLDSPEDDFERIKGPQGNVYCVPAHLDSDDILICLLLEEIATKGKPNYKRVGLTRIPPYKGTKEEVLEKTKDRHRIRII